MAKWGLLPNRPPLGSEGAGDASECYLLRKANETMFDDLTSLEGRAEEAQKPSEEEDKPARSLSRWSHVIAGLVFCLMYFPFQDHPWSWVVAIAVSYSAFTFAIALGLALDDADDFFGDSRVLRCVATLLLPHALILAGITLAAYLWLYVTPMLPPWFAHRGQRLSLWDLCGIVLVWFAGTREGIWMAGRIKRRLREHRE